MKRCKSVLTSSVFTNHARPDFGGNAGARRKCSNPSSWLTWNVGNMELECTPSTIN